MKKRESSYLFIFLNQESFNFIIVTCLFLCTAEPTWSVEVKMGLPGKTVLVSVLQLNSYVIKSQLHSLSVLVFLFVEWGSQLNNTDANSCRRSQLNSVADKHPSQQEVSHLGVLVRNLKTPRSYGKVQLQTCSF